MDNLKAFLEADAWRTQGEWEWRDRNTEYSRCYLDGLYSGDTEVCNFGNGEQYYPTEGKEPNGDDKNFIAAASRIAPDIRKLLAAFEQVCGALEHQVDLSERRKDFGEFYLIGKRSLEAAAPYRKLMGGA